MTRMGNSILYAAVVPIAVYLIAQYIDKRFENHGNNWLLIAACLLFATSPLYPSPLIHGHDTQFMTHVFGGGIFVGLLWLYFMPLMRCLPWYWRGIILYVAVSGLGVLNELYELYAHETGIISQSIADTSWDLLANTLGAGLIMAGYYAPTYISGLQKFKRK